MSNQGHACSHSPNESRFSNDNITPRVAIDEAIARVASDNDGIAAHSNQGITAMAAREGTCGGLTCSIVGATAEEAFARPR